ncbi:hypothetical protein ACRWQM_12420 [Shewanella sp. HL-SH5]|uniref:hypothetical protein n=1 Tax=unclassified Shewanella TaxID=196818 RepID=UPI003EB84457
MSIDATFLGQFFIVWLIISTIIIALLAKRKTDNPAMTTAIGFIASFIPFLSIIMMIVLTLKKDISVKDSKEVPATYT